MRLTDLVLDDWCQHRHLEVTFDKGSNGIIGPNGSGKSNLMRAIKTALIGPSGGSVAADINTRAERASVGLGFEHDGHVGRITRRFYRSASNTAKLVWNGQEVNGIKAVNEMVCALTGLTPETISKFVFISQEELRTILFETSGSRLDSLIAMLPEIASSRLIRKRVSDFIDTIPVMNLPYDEGLLKSTIQGAEEELSQATEDFTHWMVRRSALVEDGVSDPVAYIAALDQAVKVENLITEIETVELAKVDRKLQECQARYDQEDATRYAVNTAVNPELLKGYVDEYTAFNRDFFDKVTKRVDEIPHLLNNIESESVSTKYSFDLALKDSQEFNSKIAVAEAEKTRYFMELKRLSELDTSSTNIEQCPTCGSALEAGQIEEHKSAVTEQFQAAEATVKELKAELALANKPLVAAAEELKQQAALKEKLTEELQALWSTKASLKEPRLSEKEFIEASKTLNAYGAHNAQMLRLTCLKQELKDYQHKKQELQSKLDGLRSTITDVDRSLEEQVRTQLRDLQSCDRHLADASAKLTVLDDQLTKNKKLLTELEQVKESQQGVEEYRETLEQVKFYLHREELPKAFLSYYLEDLRQGLSYYLALFSSPLTIEIHDDFEMTFCKGAAAPQDITRLSGGEKSVVSVALHLAVSDLFIENVDLLMLDEPSQNMDEEYVSTLTNIIHTLSSQTGARSRQLGVVTHHVNEMRGVFDHCIVLASDTPGEEPL